MVAVSLNNNFSYFDRNLFGNALETGKCIYLCDTLNSGDTMSFETVQLASNRLQWEAIKLQEKFSLSLSHTHKAAFLRSAVGVHIIYYSRKLNICAQFDLHAPTNVCVSAI